MALKTSHTRVLFCGISIGLAAFLTHPLCSLLYGCGCRPPFLGGSSECALMPGEVLSQHACPWCATSGIILALTFTPTVVTAAFIGQAVARTGAYGLALVITLLAVLTGLLTTGWIYSLLLKFEGSGSRSALCALLSLDPGAQGSNP